MADAMRPEKRQPAGSAGQSGDVIEKSPVEARQGSLGRPVLWVLGGSLTLAFVAFLVLYFYYWEYFYYW